MVQQSPSMSSTPGAYNPTSPQNPGTPNGMPYSRPAGSMGSPVTDLRSALQRLSSIESMLPSHFEAILSTLQEDQPGLDAAERRKQFDGMIQQHGAILGSKGASAEGLQSYNQLYQLWKSIGSTEASSESVRRQQRHSMLGTVRNNTLAIIDKLAAHQQRQEEQSKTPEAHAMAALETDVQHWKRRAEHWKSMYDQLTQDKLELTAQLSEQTVKGGEVGQLKRDRDALEQTLSEHKDALEKQQKLQTEQDQTAQGLQQQREELEQRIKQLEDQNSLAAQNNQATRDELERLREKLDAAETDAQGARAEIQVAKLDKRSKDEHIDTLNKQVRQLQSDLNKVHQPRVDPTPPPSARSAAPPPLAAAAAPLSPSVPPSDPSADNVIQYVEVPVSVPVLGDRHVPASPLPPLPTVDRRDPFASSPAVMARQPLSGLGRPTTPYDSQLLGDPAEAASRSAVDLFRQPAPTASELPSAPTALPNGGSFGRGIQVELLSPTPGVLLFFTLDGSAPDPAAAAPNGPTRLYRGPLPLSDDCRILAVAVREGLGRSEVFMSEPFRFTPSLVHSASGYSLSRETQGRDPLDRVGAPAPAPQEGLLGMSLARREKLVALQSREVLYVRAVIQGGPAEKAGVKSGDVVLAAGGVEVEEKQVGMEGLKQILKGAPGEPVTLTVERSTETGDFTPFGVPTMDYKRLNLTVVRQARQPARPSSVVSAAGSAVSRASSSARSYAPVYASYQSLPVRPSSRSSSVQPGPSPPAISYLPRSAAPAPSSSTAPPQQPPCAIPGVEGLPGHASSGAPPPAPAQRPATPVGEWLSPQRFLKQVALPMGGSVDGV